MQDINKRLKGKLLETQEWYVGLLTRTAVECYLKKEGDFAVRTSEKGGTLEFVVSVRGASTCAHFTVFYEDNAGWGLNLDNQNTFPTVVDLVEYYRKHALPGGNSLKHPVKRPKWYLKHENLSYDTKRDLLGSGNFCDVYKGRLNATKSVAIKICHGPNGEKKDQDLRNAEKAKDSLIKEGSFMAEYRHPNIIKVTLSIIPVHTMNINHTNIEHP
ncbi:unnamed protein product [Anisakis simplex]|uniref:Tyrosine-protein kinase n=1 Tax=Anisakis simplex TaxID=6269 RepID=A0A0M3JV02_ANISI|nr:unnamed protein product [Anisakis simplex]